MFGRSHAGLDAVLRLLRPSQWDLFLGSPLKYLARFLYNIEQRKQPPEQTSTGLKIVCISDGHDFETNIPYGEVLIHTGGSNRQDLQSVLTWLRGFPHPHKIMTPGVSYALTRLPERAKLDWTGITLLDNSSVTIKCSGGRELKVFGSNGKSHPRHPGTWGFSGPDFWAGPVPMDTDILISYMPPGQRFATIGPGDDSLLKQMWRTKPRLHVSGNTWAGHGKERIIYDRFGALFEKICSSPKAPMAFIQLMEMLIRLVGFMIWRARSDDGTMLVRVASPGRLKHLEKNKPIVVYL